MFTTPQRRGGASTLYNSPRTSVPLTKGLFSDGVWNCNCSPRLPATHFQVKKEGRNKGRWFYTCQTNKEDGGCGFFLWDEEAKPREAKTVMNNSRSEVTSGTDDGATGSKVGQQEDHGRPNNGTTNFMGNGQMPAMISQGSSEDFGEWLLSLTTSKKVVEDTEVRYSSPPWPETQPETPRKALKSSPFTTPQSKRKRNYDPADETHASEALPTPVTGGAAGERRVRSASEDGYNDSDPFSTPSTLRIPSQFGMRSPSHTPTPNISRIQRPTSPLEARQDSGPVDLYDITSDVLTLLREENVYLENETESKLKALLGKHAMRVSGVARGRDITRVALRSKDSKIAELGVRIGQLEAEREVDKRVIKSLAGEGRSKSRDG